MAKFEQVGTCIGVHVVHENLHLLPEGGGCCGIWLYLNCGHVMLVICEVRHDTLGISFGFLTPLFPRRLCSLIKAMLLERCHTLRLGDARGYCTQKLMWFER